MRRKIIVFITVTDKRTRLGKRIDVYITYSLEEIEAIYKKVSKYTEEKFISLYTDLEGYEPIVYNKNEALRVLYICAKHMSYVQAIDECCEKYNGLEDDIDELLIEDEPFDNIDNYLRETVDDSLYNYMEPKYVPKGTLVGEVLQDVMKECRAIVIKDLSTKEIIYCKNFCLKDSSQNREYKDELSDLLNYDLDNFLLLHKTVVEEKNINCWQKVYFI